MNYKKLIPQYILALMMLVFGLNKFFGFMAMPKPDGDALTYMTGLAASGYTFPALGILYIACSILLFLSRAVGLALVVLSPLAINALLYHLFLKPESSVAAFVFCFLIAATAWFYRERFKGLFQ